MFFAIAEYFLVIHILRVRQTETVISGSQAVFVLTYFTNHQSEPTGCT